LFFSLKVNSLFLHLLTYKAECLLKNCIFFCNFLCNSKLIIESSFKFTFWIQLNLKSSCSYFQFNSSWVEHIFNSTRRDLSRNWINSTRLIKNSSLTSRELNIEIFSLYIIFLHYLFAFDKELFYDRKLLYDRELFYDRES